MGTMLIIYRGIALVRRDIMFLTNHILLHGMYFVATQGRIKHFSRGPESTIKYCFQREVPLYKFSKEEGVPNSKFSNCILFDKMFY
jgi:hypothetical protein